ncbi:hypothetical protein CONCODRAFT_73123 [Conidiobolus coronatus NRRL 28638]|uniref:Uncharacterized protein n=1 Tax=Conidiobolus coronatus (strain ATCC 28846 / CBS 209.66 / NRRL 28638) TaxID=796925 RepID=A0A137NWP0_CONC2|nr:hypothetical protein CONCODRAFT_73123 [Conidiobolus coronatus NRRL 28638]|eukprot:KXN67255.1 hypothetical protein CONCODRAFT_73123 [Conidiobolus coronatus NRRL 28638]
MAFGTFLHIRVSLKGGANSLSKYYSLMNWYLDQLDSNTASNLSSHQRLAYLMGLSSLLGVDPLNYSKVQPFCTSNQCSFNNVKRALSVLQNYTGLSNPQFLGDLKTCRSVVNMTSQLIHSSNLEPRDDTLYRRLLITVNSNLQISGSNLEPRDYSRFSLATSYLRSIYESLSQFGGAKEYFDVNLMLIETLDSLSLPLPPVNWFPILSSMAPLCKDNNRVILLKFVVNNFLKSNSIMEFFLNELDQLQISLPNHNKESLDLLLGMEGFGTVLKLVGFGALEDRSNLRGGWGAILKLVTVSLRRLEATLIKTCQMMIRKPKLYEALTTLLATLSNCLQAGISNDVNKSELERVLESWSKFFKESYFSLDIASIDSAYDPLLTLIVGLASYDRATIEEMITSLGSKSNSQTHIGPILYHQLLINNREGIKSTLKVFSYCLEEGVTTVSLIEWLLKCLAMNLEFQTVISLLNLVILATSNAQDKVTIVARGITYLIGIFQRKLIKNPQSDAANSIVSHIEFTKLTTILFQIRVEFNKFDLKMIVNRLKILEDSLTSSSDNEDDSTLLILNIWQKVLNF